MGKWFANLKIANKLTVGFAVVIVLAIAIGVFGVVNLLSVSNNEKNTFETATLNYSIVEKAVKEFLDIRINTRDIYIHYDADKTSYYTNIENDFNSINEKLSAYSVVDSQDLKNVNDIKPLFAAYKDAVTAIVNAAKQGKPTADILKMISDSGTAGNNLDKQFDINSDYNLNVTKTMSDKDVKTASTTTYIMIGIICGAVIIAVVFGVYTARLIGPQMKKFAEFAKMLAIGDIDVMKVIEEKDKAWALRKDEVGVLADSFLKVIGSTQMMCQQTQAIAGGDLTTSVTVRSEYDILGIALKELVEKFHDLASSISIAAEQVSSGANLVSNSSMTLSQGASEQASSVQELTASLEEVSSKTTQNADNAQKANGLAQNAKTDAETGNAQMREMLVAMDEINTSSASISKIIKVIDDIAFQTNILALNAAVEAARAGQHGKGFAVVAEEVRTLAARSAQAAKETTDLIESSIRKVEAGTRIANVTADALGKIVGEVSSAAELVASIAVASDAQAAAVLQINQGISQVSSVVQNNAATSEESAAASEELNTQAEQLKETIGVFKLRTSAASPGGPSARRTAESSIRQLPSMKKMISMSAGESGKY